jgi:Site-specific recombinase XerD
MDMPPIVDKYINHQRVIRGRSEKTLEQYKIDLTLFFRFFIARRDGIALDDIEAFNNINFTTLSQDEIIHVTREDMYEFFNYTAIDRENISRTRARKLSSLRSFYHYVSVTLQLIADNPAADIESPAIKSSLPKFLSLDESIALLEAVSNDEESKSRERDYAIITLFLNTGMRLSELAGISLNDMDKELRSIRILGKRNKERIVYLNEACGEALTAYLLVRANDLQNRKITDEKALFISRNHKRISIKTVQWMVNKYLEAADLGHKNYSVHKLRHTAATLMYQTGEVDVRVLKDILGHEQLNTTQIYTHVSDANMENAMKMNPLAKVNSKNTKKTDEDVNDE